ncbi:hypothetical protein FRX31_020610 [Thalictrum thalictroides]|uniref:DUF7086 domain-containing protein n=1 Tax=Thalictrum thalictroides TaxID=46969 RepID=A0A7J6VXE1_THATH|nr:hypothetical protein FRX31_020610 [Thalictrum thalictroides]
MEHLDPGLNLDLSLSSMNDLHQQFNNNEVQQHLQDHQEEVVLGVQHVQQEEVVHGVQQELQEEIVLGIDHNIQFEHHQPLNLPVLNPVLPSLEEFTARDISVIQGRIQCNNCKHRRTVQINLIAGYTRIFNFFQNLDNRRNFFSLQDNSGDLMPEPDDMKCTSCKRAHSMRPEANLQINQGNWGDWLFILLGKWICMVDHDHLVGLFPGNEYVGDNRNLQFDSCMGLLSQLDPIGSQQLLYLYAPIWVL